MVQKLQGKKRYTIKEFLLRISTARSQMSFCISNHNNYFSWALPEKFFAHKIIIYMDICVYEETKAIDF